MAASPPDRARTAVTTFHWFGADEDLAPSADALASHLVRTVGFLSADADLLEDLYPTIKAMVYGLLDTGCPEIAERLNNVYAHRWSLVAKHCRPNRRRRGRQRLQILKSGILHRGNHTRRARTLASSVLTEIHVRVGLQAKVVSPDQPDVHQVDLDRLATFLGSQSPFVENYRAALSMLYACTRAEIRYHPSGSPFVIPSRYFTLKELTTWGAVALSTMPRTPDNVRNSWHDLALGHALTLSELVHTELERDEALTALHLDPIVRPADWRGQLTIDVPRIKIALLNGDLAQADYHQHRLNMALARHGFVRHMRVMAMRGWDRAGEGKRAG